MCSHPLLFSEKMGAGVNNFSHTYYEALFRYNREVALLLTTIFLESMKFLHVKKNTHKEKYLVEVQDHLLVHPTQLKWLAYWTKMWSEFIHSYSKLNYIYTNFDYLQEFFVQFAGNSSYQIFVHELNYSSPQLKFWNEGWIFSVLRIINK